MNFFNNVIINLHTKQLFKKKLTKTHKKNTKNLKLNDIKN